MSSVPQPGVAQKLQADRLKYPGLLPDEALVLRAWLRLHENEYDGFDYNVRIGPDLDPGPQFAQAVRDQTILARKLRIDAVAMQQGVPTIIEVKRRATPANIGQLVTYQHVWMNENPGSPTPKLLLICSDYTPAIIPAVQNTGITLDVLKVDFSVLSNSNRAPTI